MSIDSNQRARIAGHGRAPDASAPAANVQAGVGKPSAEHSQYGLVREGSKEAEGLTEPQIRGVEPTGDPSGDPKGVVSEKARAEQAVKAQPSTGRDSASEDRSLNTPPPQGQTNQTR